MAPPANFFKLPRGNSAPAIGTRDMFPKAAGESDEVQGSNRRLVAVRSLRGLKIKMIVAAASRIELGTTNRAARITVHVLTNG